MTYRWDLVLVQIGPETKSIRSPILLALGCDGIISLWLPLTLPLLQVKNSLSINCGNFARRQSTNEATWALNTLFLNRVTWSGLSEELQTSERCDLGPNSAAIPLSRLYQRDATIHVGRGEYFWPYKFLPRCCLTCVAVVGGTSVQFL